MRYSSIFLPFAAALLLPAAAYAGQERPVTEGNTAQSMRNASISFANNGGVRDWRAEGDDTVYFRDAHNRWYKAELFSPALDLPFANAIGIDAGATGNLDRFGAILVRGQRYPFKSFTLVDGPPTKQDKDDA